MERVLPSTINYQDVLPLSVPAIARRKKFYPQNGTTFSNTGSSEIRIEIGSVNSLLDTQHSYLEFEIVNRNAIAATVGFDMGGGAVFFDTVRIEQGGRVLSELQSYNRLNASVLDQTQTSWNGKMTESLTQGQKGNNDVVGGLAGAIAPAPAGGLGGRYGNFNGNTNAQIPAGGSYRFTIPIISGLFTQDKLIPLPLVAQNAPITISLQITNSSNVGVWTAAPGAGDIEIRAISYNAQLIEVGRDVLEQIKQTQEIMGGQLAISGQDWEHSQGQVPALTTGETVVRMPSRKRSINSFFWIANSDTFAGAANIEDIYNLSYCGTCNVDSWQLKVGSVVYPPTAIDDIGPAVAAGAFRRGEPVMELAKALGTLKFVNPTGRINTCTYGTAIAGVGALGIGNGDNLDGVGGVIAPGDSGAGGEPHLSCPRGLDTTSFQHEALEAGIDTETLSQETNLILNISTLAVAAGGTSGREPKNIHMWILYDQHYYFNSNGMITFSN